MKKILTLFAVVGLFAFSSCSDDNNNGDGDTISEVFEVSGVNFTSTNSFSTLVDLNPSIYDSDVILVYRLSAVENGRDIWKLLPDTYFFADGTRNFSYEFDFTQDDINIFMDGNNLGTVAAGFRTNQVFRIVIVPGAFSTTGKSVKPDYSDYNAVIAKYNIDDTNVKKLN
jgi:hypothetical protein